MKKSEIRTMIIEMILEAKQEQEKKDYYAIIFNNRTLSGYHPNGFAGGMREAFVFRSNSSIIYNGENKAKDEIKRMNNDLDKWIEKDIPKQAKNWSKDKVDDFLDESKKLYNKMKKNVKRFKIIKS